MKVLFLNPSRAGQGNIPLNIPILIAALKAHGHEVRLFDMSDYAVFSDESYDEMFFKKGEFNSTEVIRDRKEFYKGDPGRSLPGLDLRRSDYRVDFEYQMRNFKPDIIAVSCLSVDFRFACEFLKPFREKHKTAVIFGGIHAVLLPEEVLSSGSCDFVCTGEGENSLVELLNAIENKSPLENIRGIWFKASGRIIKNPPMPLSDLDKLPIPDYDCFDPIHFYRPFDGKRYKMLNYELSRGCPFSCSYCVNGVLKEKYDGLGRYHRIKGIRHSIIELESLIEKYGFNFVRFWDEDFTSINADYMAEYAEAYVRRVKLPFLVYARVDTVTERKVRILKRIGCRTFAMGIESGNDFIRRRVMFRNISDKMLVEKFGLIASYKIRTSAYNIIGLPHETRARIFDTIGLNRKISPSSFSVTLLEPYRGTPIRKMCEEEGLDPSLDPGNRVFLGEPQFVPKGMTAAELKGLFRTFPFYVRFPESRYDEIRSAETDDDAYRKLKEEHIKNL